jgi:cell division septation protein DedD
MLVRCPQCQYANQVEADATKPRIVCARCATVISVEFLSHPSVPPAFESPVSEVPAADMWAGELPPSEPTFMKTPESPLDLDSLLETPGEAVPTPPLAPPPPVLQATTASLESRWDADEILDIPRAAAVGEAQHDPLAVEDLLAAPPLTTSSGEFAEPLLTEAEPVLETTADELWGTPLETAEAMPQTAAFAEASPAQFTNGDYAEAEVAPEVQPEPQRPSVFAQDSYTRNVGSTFVMATPETGNKGRLAKIFLVAGLAFLLLLVGYVGLSGFVKDWFARRNQQAAATPGSTEATTGSAVPSVAPSLGAKTDANGKKASPSASVAASAKPSASPSATATPAAANQNAASKPTPTPPPTGTSGPAVGSSDGSLTIQLGSYKTAGEAQARVAKLKAAGVEGRVVKADVAGKGTWYRVHSGRFTSESEASKHANELRAKGATRDFIVTGYQNE